MDTAALVAKLLACVAALESGNPLGCLSLLTDVIRRLEAVQLPARIELGEQDEPYIWDRPFGGEPECLPFE